VRRGRRDFGVTCTLRADLVRNYGPEAGSRVLQWIRGKGDNVVAIDLGGGEMGYPPKPYAEVYAEAARMGLRLVAHAGEAAGPESVRDAIECLNVERIGHGVSAAGDPATLGLLKSRGVTVECCPVSNLRTQAVGSIREHPIRRFIENGIRVTVSSDDPPMFGTDMNNEYAALAREAGFSAKQLAEISLESVLTSFLPETRKKEMKEEFRGEILKLLG
jgi:adenosine deaminase